MFSDHVLWSPHVHGFTLGLTTVALAQVMLRNIPNRYTCEELLSEVIMAGFDRMPAGFSIRVTVRPVSGCLQGTTTGKCGVAVAGRNCSLCMHAPQVIEEPLACFRFDFFYLPMDFKTKRNRGYGFINFHSTSAAKQPPGVKELGKPRL